MSGLDYLCVGLFLVIWLGMLVDISALEGRVERLNDRIVALEKKGVQ